MPREILVTPTLYNFENIKVYGAEKPEQYLTYLYGNWQKMPPEEKRKTHHDFISIDLSKSFLKDEVQR